MTDSDMIDASLEAVAQSGVDIVPAYFERFYSTFPEQLEAFNRPNATQGAMVNEMISFIAASASEEAWVDAAVDDTAARHSSYGEISPDQFKRAIDILIEVLANAGGAAWRPEHTDVWLVHAKRIEARLRQFQTQPGGQLTCNSTCGQLVLQGNHGI